MGVVISVPGRRPECFLYSVRAYREIAASTTEALTRADDRVELDRAEIYHLLEFRVDDASLRVAAAMRVGVTKLACERRASGDDGDVRFAARLAELARGLDRFIADPRGERAPIPPITAAPTPPTAVVRLPGAGDAVVLPGCAYRRLLERAVPLLIWPDTIEAVANAWWEGTLRLDLEPDRHIGAALRQASEGLVDELEPELLAELQCRLDAYLADGP